MAESMDKKYSNVPNLRFSKFSENYSSCRFVDALTFLNSNSFSRDEMNFDEGNYKNIHYGDILIKFPTLVDSKSTLIPFVNKNVVVTPKMNLLKDGDIVIADTAEDYTAGKAIELVVGKDKILSGLHTIPCRPRFKFSSGYLGYYLNSSSFRKNLLPLIQGIKVYSVSKYMFNSLYIKYPSLEEQQKVSDLLFKIDHRISTQNKIIREKESYKCAIINKFFSKSPETYEKLQTFVIKGKAGGTPKSTEKNFYNGNIPFLSISDMTEQGKYINKTEKHLSSEGLKNSSSWLVPKGSLIFSMYASVGLPAINTIDLCTSQAMFSMIIKPDYNVEYLYYYLLWYKANKIHRFLETGTQSNINADYVKKILVPIFEEKETDLMVKILTKIDESICAEKTILKKLLIQKQYFLNNLFI